MRAESMTDRGIRRRKARPRGHLASVRDDLLASMGRGKEHALAMVDAILRIHKRRPIQITDSWQALHDALGLAQPVDKTARAALALLRDLTPVVSRVSPQRWRIDTTIIGSESGHRSPSNTDTERGLEPTEADTESRHRSPSNTDTESGQRLDASWTPPTSGKPANPGRSTAVGSVPALPRVRARVDLDGHPPWMNNPLALMFADRLEGCGVHNVGHMLAVTLTVPDGVDLADVAASFARRCAGASSGAWLVPETSRKGRLHLHGLVITPHPAALVPTWQRSGGGIPPAQEIEPIAPEDGKRLRGAIAYALKRRDLEPGEIIATGLLAMPWAFALEGQAPTVDGRHDAPEELPGS